MARDASLSAPVRDAAQKVVPVRPDLRVLRDVAGKCGLPLPLRHPKTTVGWAGQDAVREFDSPGSCPERGRDCRSAADVKEFADALQVRRAPPRLAARQKAEIPADRAVVAARSVDVDQALTVRC